MCGEQSTEVEVGLSQRKGRQAVLGGMSRVRPCSPLRPGPGAGLAQMQSGARGLFADGALDFCPPGLRLGPSHEGRSLEPARPGQTQWLSSCSPLLKKSPGRPKMVCALASALISYFWTRCFLTNVFPLEKLFRRLRILASEI